MDNARRHTILAVDDERMNLNVLNRILSPEYTLLIAKTGDEAVMRAQSRKPDLILLDLMLPDMSGFEALRKLKEQHETQGIPVVIITALDSGADEARALELGAAGYIRKPFSADEVLTCVKNMVVSQGGSI